MLLFYASIYRKLPLLPTSFLGIFITIALYFQPNYYLWAQPISYQGDQVEFTHPQLDAQFTYYEVYAFDVSALHEEIQGLLHYDFELQLGETHHWSINLSLNEMYAPDFQLIELTEEGEQLLPLPSPFTYEGFNNASETEAGNTVRLSIREDAIVGYVYHNEQQFYIEPLSYFLEDAPSHYYLVYQPAFINIEMGEACGAALQQAMRPYRPEEAMDLSKNEENCMQVEMLVLATQDMVAHLGSTFSVTNRIFDISNQMEGYYSFANFDFVLSQLYISTSQNADPVSSTIVADTLMNEMRLWAANSNNNVHRHDLGQLWVKRDIAGCDTDPPTNFDLWGCGKIGAVCQGFRYNVCELVTSNVSCMAKLSAHEIGHNFNGNHSDGPNATDLMHASISCSTNQGFSTASQNTIHAYVASPLGRCVKLCSELCDLAISGYTVSNVTCPGGQDGSLTIAASTSYGPIEYGIAGPVTQNNMTGYFPNLPAGTYNLFVFDPQFDSCQDQDLATVLTDEDASPIVVCPENETVENASGECNAQVSIPQPSTSDPCGIAQTEYRFQQVDANGNPLGSWSAWQNWSSTDLNPSETLIVGNWKIEWRVTDSSGNESLCSFCIEVVDAEPFLMYCPGAFVSPLSTGFCISFIEMPLPQIIDNCEEYELKGRTREVDAQGNPLPGTAGQWSNYSSNLDGFFYVGFFEVEWMATDIGQNTRQCSFQIEVKDEESPILSSCSSGIRVANDPGECEAYVAIPIPNANDNCGVSWLQARYRRVDGQNNPIPGPFGAWSQFASDISGDYAVGNYQIQWEAQDPSGNSDDCSFFLSVLDEESPVAHCRNNTVYLDFNGQYAIQDFDVFDLFQSGDNCGGLQLAIQPPAVDCSDANSVVPVQVLAVDDAGNAQGCVSFLQVEKSDALPPGWDNDAIGFTTGDATFDPCADSFTLQSVGVSSPFDDLIQMAFQSQCGNFELIAKVDQISNGGFAGIMIRENNYSGAKKIALKTQLTTRVYRQFRFSTDGYTTTNALQRFPVHPWLRLKRSGSNFTGYSSYNGSNWRLAFSVSLHLPNCILAGLYVESLNGSAMTTAQFSQVSFNGVSPLQMPDEFPSVSNQQEDIQASSIHLYPNPSKDFLNIDLKAWNQQPVEVKIINISGQVMWHQSLVIPDHTPLEIAITKLPNGIYFLKASNGFKTASRRFSKN